MAWPTTWWHRKNRRNFAKKCVCYSLPKSKVLPNFLGVVKGASKSWFALCLGLMVAGRPDFVPAQTEGEYQAQPIFSRYGATQSNWVTLNTTARLFSDVQLQEVDRFDGWSLDADLTVRVPWTERWQARLYWPFYTEGSARVTKPGLPETGRRIDIHGSAGLFDFANVQLECQLLRESEHGFNLGLHGGYGWHTEVLWTSTLGGDRYNDQGNVGLGGLRADWRVGPHWRFLAGAGGRYYWVSDDLNPVGGDQFWFMDASVAAVYHPWKAPVYPVAELVYQGDLSQFNSLLFVPEILFAPGFHLEFKAGATIGLTGDGEGLGGRLQATVRF